MQRSLNTFRNHGFSLLEVLVTVLIISVGLLGLAGMQMKAFQHTNDSYNRSQASLLAYDIADRIRGNLGAIDTYKDADTAAVTTTTDCKTAACGIDQIADYDLESWKQDVENQLPMGRGIITNSGSEYTITIMWDEKREGTGSDCSTLQCFSLTTEFEV
ncbi:MAG: type IV pilus modification protein PilV [Pseudomonadota bacterium]